MFTLNCFGRSYRLFLSRCIAELLLILIGRTEELLISLGLVKRAGVMVPDFFIVGAQKSGTTSLFSWLDQLPDFKLAKRKVSNKSELSKESQFFSNPMIRLKGLRWYSSLFLPGVIKGDKTPEYLFRKASLREISRHCPGARIIVMLRNPVDRAFSAYGHYKRMLPLSRNWDWLLPRAGFSENILAELSTGFRLGFLARGRYAEQLENVYALFPEKQVKVLIFENFITDPSRSFADIVSFLGGTSIEWELSYTPVNVGKYRSQMDAETRRVLADYYRPYNERLFEMIGFRINEWD